MKNIYKSAIILLGAVSLLCGCIKETFPTSVASSEQVAQSASAVKSMAAGMHAFVNNFGTLGDDAYDWGYPSICLIRETMCEDLASVPSGYEWYSSWMQNSYQGDGYVYGQFIWNYFTKFLLTANSVISAVPEDVESASSAAYLAMAFCYRAMINLDMGRMYEFKKNSYTSAPELEGLTIPIIKENLTEEQARNNPRVPKAELIDFIVSDLEKAVKLFGGETFASDKDKSKLFSRLKMNEPDITVAFGLLARTYLWKEDYENAAKYAQLALDAGSYTPLNENQWTDPKTGFNNATSQSSWMWGSILAAEDDVVKTGILNWASWMCSETTFGYASAGPFRLCDVSFYAKISDNDFRKKSWVAPKGSPFKVPMVSATADFDPTVIPEYASVKFRPGSGNPDDPNTGTVVDFPLMRCEEMYFILAECAARKGDKSVLEQFMKKYRDAYYACTASDLVAETILQKRIEFWGEGIVFFDYKRLNMPVTRGYAGTNHIEKSRFNTIGLAPWMNLCVVKSENTANPAFISNPDPSDLVEEWTE